MRALYESALVKAEVGYGIIVKDDSFHHLVNVVRIKTGEEILVFNGKGLEALAVVEKLEKRQATLKVLELTHHQFSEPLIDVFLGTPKKEALELCLRQAVELGVSKIFLAETAYAQKPFLNDERKDSILSSSLIQSNNPFLPELVDVKGSDIDAETYDQIIIFDSVNKGVADLSRKDIKRVLIVIGPEGGFSAEELEVWKLNPKTVSVHLPTPIMRTPTALSCAIGFTLGKLN